jgi:hypothetical protein
MSYLTEIFKDIEEFDKTTEEGLLEISFYVFNFLYNNGIERWADRVVRKISNKGLLEILIRNDEDDIIELNDFKRYMNFKYKINCIDGFEITDDDLAYAAACHNRNDILQYLMEEKKAKLTNEQIDFIITNKSCVFTEYLLKSGRINTDFMNGKLFMQAVKWVDKRGNNPDYEVLEYLVTTDINISQDDYELLESTYDKNWNNLRNNIIKKYIRKYKRRNKKKD